MSRKNKRHKQKTSGHDRLSSVTRLQDHKIIDKTLIPPFAQIPRVVLKSWMNDRLPEVLWALLLVTMLPREIALSRIRALGKYIFDVGEPETTGDVTITGFSRLPTAYLVKTLEFICDHEMARLALRPLILFPELPAIDTWTQILGAPVPEEDWQRLMVAVGRSLSHQSQEATDARWARLLGLIAAHRLKLPTKEHIKEILEYPDYGDQRHVRPSIRASEGALSSIGAQARSPWVDHFWSYSLSETKCWPLQLEESLPIPLAGTTRDRVENVRESLRKWQAKTTTSTGIDPRHDTVFGMALYSIYILEELFRIGISTTIGGRLLLRSLAEAALTLRYLSDKDDQELWKSYRVFGAGQAKLLHLKFEESNVPSYVDIEVLKQLANEDLWEEYLEINLGHWEKANLRKLSEDIGKKDLYDKYYTWPSVYSHAHWAAVRETVFVNCGNPLHRLHHITRESAKPLPDVLTDACLLVDEILCVLDKCYPSFACRVTVGEKK